ncbi:MaoC family dehydratase [Calidithermus chliarophilus]|uniref:MaoC family dehydratase n=1 Tax=Calidithermus chliarophilus TaxID=52023 RepID=UPI0003FB087E|nr:MaoC family dehydratase [Calidithermus chliarophilus]
MKFKVGDAASYSQTISEASIAMFVGAVGDTNPLHVDAEYAKKSRFGGRIAQGILVAGLISTCIGTKLPGVGAVYLGQSLKFLRPTHVGDTITATVTVTAIREDKPILTLQTVCTNQRGERVIEGEATVLYEEPA